MKSFIRIFSITFGLVVVTFFNYLPASAQVINGDQQGLEISPTRVELNAAKGNTYTVKLNIRNVTVSDLDYTYSVNDFNAADETGAPHIIMDGNMPESASIKTWISGISDFSLKSKKFTTLNINIAVPANAEPGGHYGVIRFSGGTPDLENSNVGVSVSAGVLLLIRVDGIITEKASLASFFSARPDGKQSSFFETAPITFVTRIRNEGNTHVKPAGNIEVRDIFGGLVSRLGVGNGSSNVLPNSIRRFEAKLDKPWMIGLYTANLTMGYGSTGQAITSTIKFWVIPIRLIVIVLFILITLIYIFIRLIKVYNKHIIEKANTKNKNHEKDYTPDPSKKEALSPENSDPTKADRT